MKLFKNILLIGAMSCAPFIALADGHPEIANWDDMVAVIDFLKTEMSNHGQDFAQMKMNTTEMMNHFDEMDQKRHEAFESIRSEFENLNNLLAICEQQKAEHVEHMNIKQSEVDMLSNDLGLRDSQIDQLNNDLVVCGNDYQVLVQEHDQCVNDHDAFVADTTQRANEIAQRLVDLSNGFNAMNIERNDFVASNQQMHDRINNFALDHDQEGHNFVDEICSNHDLGSENE